MKKYIYSHMKKEKRKKKVRIWATRKLRDPPIICDLGKGAFLVD